MGARQRLEHDFAGYVRMRLRHIGMSQAQLARNTGISRPALVKLLNGRTRAPRLETTRAMASALGVSPIHLLRLLTDDQDGALAESPADNATFSNAAIIDVTVPNGTRVAPGERFEKVWDVRNTGTIEWRGRRLRCIDQALSPSLDGGTRDQYFLRPDAIEIPVPYAAPGDLVRLAVWFTAPRLPVACVSMWRIVDLSGLDYFAEFNPLNVMVLVAEQ